MGIKKENRISVKEYRERNKEKVYAANKKYRELHPDYARNYNRKQYAKRKEYIDKLKSIPCADCGQVYHPAVMDFDHVRGEKFKDIALMYRSSMEKLKEEIAKCDIVCANCHRMRTYKKMSRKGYW